jgi:hypothetical protein
MGDDIGSGLSFKSVCFDFCSKEFRELLFTYCMYLGFLPSQLVMQEVERLILFGLNWLEST